MKIFNTPNFNFVRWRWQAIALSLVIVLAGAAMVYRHGLPLGVEFEGGSMVVLKFEQPPDMQQIRNALATGMPGGDDAIVQSYGETSQHQVMVRVVGGWRRERRRTEPRREPRHRDAAEGQRRQVHRAKAVRSWGRSSDSS